MYNNDNILIEQLGIDLFAGESLCEFATVARDYTNNLTVAVNPDSRKKFGNSQYFKVYDSSEPKKASRILRIKFRTNEYIIHSNPKNLKTWNMNGDDIDNLISLLNSPSKRDLGYSVWQSLIISFNYETGLDKIDTIQNYYINPKYPEYLPIDLKIPNYEDGIIYEKDKNKKKRY